MILSGTGWTPAFENTLTYAGTLAASVSNFFSGTTKQASQEQTDLREQQQKAIADIQTEQLKQQTATISSYLDLQRAKTFLKQWWWLSLIIAFILFRKPIMRFIGVKALSTAPKRSKRSTTKQKTVKTNTRSKTGKKNTPKTPKKTTGFSRKIHGRTYTDRTKWARAMQRLRNK